MPSPSDTVENGQRRFGAREVDTAISNAIWDVRHTAKIPLLHADSELVMACAVAADIWARYNRLFRDSAKIKDDAARDRVAAILWSAVDPVLHRTSEMRPTTQEGHRARAAVFLAWDAGEMLARAETGGIFDKLSFATVTDLL